jgi:SAM-dependent methyltransferase
MKENYLSGLIHATSPYADFDPAAHGYNAPDLTGWNSTDPQFKRLITRHKPEAILEIGSWKGASAIHMANLLKESGLHNSRIVCVDTWLGALEFWTKKDDSQRHQSLRLRHGYPTVYYTFLANVVLTGNQNCIIPFPVPSLLGARFFLNAKCFFPLIYIDGSHEYEDVLADLRACWRILKPGGVMFGDDFAQWWPGVIRSVLEFCEQKDVPLVRRGNKWQIEKPAI